MSKLYTYLCIAGNTLLGLSFHRKYCSEWDKQLNLLLDNNVSTKLVNGNLEIVNGRTENLYELWTNSKWYSYGYIYKVNGKYVDQDLQRRPSIKTMIRLDSIVQGLKQEDFNKRKKMLDASLGGD